MSYAPESTILPTGFTRLHVATLWIPTAELARGLILPALVASFFFTPVGVLSFCGLFIVLPHCLGKLVQYLSYGYSLGPSALAIRSGLLGRTWRNLPYERIQDVRIRQPLFYRMLGYAKVEIETAASESVELALDVVTLAESERIRRIVTGTPAAADTPVTSTAASELESLHQTTMRELVWGGMTTQLVAFFGAVASALLYFLVIAKLGGLTWQQWNPTPHVTLPWEDWTPKILASVPWLAPVITLLTEDTLGKALLLGVAGLMFSIVQFAATYHGFTLQRSDRLIKRTFGLLTRQEFMVPLNRIQILRVETNLLRRWFQLVSIRMDTASHRQVGEEEKKRPRAGVLLPVVTLPKASSVVAQVMPGLNWPGVTWQSVAPQAVARKTRRDCLVLALLVLPLLQPFGPYALLPLCLAPLVYWRNKAWYRHLGYALSGDYFLLRKGWYEASTTIVPLRSIQSVVLTQNPLEQRAGLASLTLEVGGSDHTGGVPLLPYLTRDTALQLHRLLTDQAAAQPFSW